MSDSMDIAVATDQSRSIRRTLQSIDDFAIASHEYESTIDMLTRLANNAIIIRHEAIVVRARIAKAKRAFDREMRKAIRSKATH